MESFSLIHALKSCTSLGGKEVSESGRRTETRVLIGTCERRADRGGEEREGGEGKMVEGRRGVDK